ncbi:PorA family protein [Streptomyces sp. 7R007]
MRRTASPLSLILLGLGTFLLVLAPMLAWYVEPRAAVNPIDIDITAVYSGTGAYFDTDAIRTVHDKRITVTQQVRGDVADSERSGRAVWDVTTTVDTDKSLPAADPHDALEFFANRWVTDRHTNKPVHCCHENPYFEGDAYLKFPFDVHKRSYTWWDNSLGSTVVLHYAGTRKVQGYTGYRFTGTVPPTRIGSRLVPGTLVDEPNRPQVLAEEWYSNHGIELVVDQRTGRVLYAQVGPRRTLRAPGHTKDAVLLLDSRKLGFTTATQKEQVKLAKKESGQLRAVGQTLPITTAVAGFVLAAVGGVLVLRGRERPDPPETPGAPLTM